MKSSYRYIAVILAVVIIGVLAVGCDQTEDGINNGIITGLLVGAGLWGVTQAGEGGAALSSGTSDSIPPVVRYDGASGVGLGYTGGGTSTDTTGGGTGSGVASEYTSAKFPPLLPLPTATYLGKDAVEVTRFNPMAYNRPMSLPAKGSGQVNNEKIYTIFFGTIRNVTGTVVNPKTLDEDNPDSLAEDYFVPGIDFRNLNFFVDYYDVNGVKLFSDLWSVGSSLYCLYPVGKLQYPTINDLSDAQLSDATNKSRYPEMGFYLLRPFDERIFTARIRRIGYGYQSDKAWDYFNYYFINVEQFNRSVKGLLQPFTMSNKVLGVEPETPPTSGVKVVATFFDKYDNVVDVQVSPELAFDKEKDPEMGQSGVAKFEITSVADFDRFQLNWTTVIKL
ncbi:MAG: hypothetical protein CVV64_09065 [Candidatus Wallbacteria bacterium HGW-Wallbacteria-1]|jgi:hypothetical protein|uniref:Uncharacterized protein n=1 Tax=Candidatus Wallbacteria bacterium HGW-Wallbacteria-1 TaxID=2013854 RepID=A0A2N1PQ95_9BACT|nr:MAG: hypothetical protein CVV64_09065 [Candidatus Wallbacteria bacterium HGW-Wallbacteria-1]